MPVRTKAYLALLTTTLIWGAAFPIIKPSLSVISPFQFLFFRYLIAAPLTLPILIYFLYKTRPSLKTILKIILIEFFGAPLALSVLYLGLQQTSAIETSLISATSPILITLGGVFFLKEREEKQEWWGLIISFVGTLLLVFEPLFNGHSLAKTFSFSGNLIILTYNFIITAYYLLAKKYYASLPKFLVTSISYSLSFLSFGLWLKLTHTPTPINLLNIPSVALAAVYMSLFGSIIALFARLYGQDLIEASEACLFEYLQGVIAIPFAFLLLKELPSSIEIVAIVIISLGVYLAEKRSPRKLAKKTK